MKKLFTLILISFLVASTALGQGLSLNKLIKNAASTGPSKDEIAAGIKEALEAGVSAGTERLSLIDGFLGNQAIKILFPPEAQKVESTLRGLGMNKLCDDLIVSLNRAAEQAAKEAKPVFVTAIKEMSFADATSILMGKQPDAATQYFKQTTTAPLQERFMPIIKTNLDKAGASKHWTDVMTQYNKVPFVKKVNTDLNSYVTQKAIDGLFTEVAKEELKIRQNPAARSSALLQKVFGHADSSK